jgi:hypothetical protein
MPASLRSQSLAPQPPSGAPILCDQRGRDGLRVLSRVHWVRPELVAEVKFLTWTDDNLLRQVVYPTNQVRRAPPDVRGKTYCLRCVASKPFSNRPRSVGHSPQSASCLGDQPVDHSPHLHPGGVRGHVDQAFFTEFAKPRLLASTMTRSSTKIGVISW